jgi:glycosyltransferase involved in cell wall biosynthesis
MYQACDLFVLPSAGEGFGIVFLEAMHYGKPIIAASSGATSEVVKDGESGLLVEYGNVEQLTEAIVALSLDTGLRARMGRTGSERLHQLFSFDSFKCRLREIVLGELSSRSAQLDERQIARGANSFT